MIRTSQRQRWGDAVNYEPVALPPWWKDQMVELSCPAGLSPLANKPRHTAVAVKSGTRGWMTPRGAAKDQEKGLTPKFHSFTLVYVFTFTGSAVLRICSVSDPSLPEQNTGLLFLLDAGAWCSNSAEFSTGQTGSHTPKQQHNICLILSVLTPPQK